jgi:hypothetical protein
MPGAKFVADFDLVGLILSVAAGMLLLFFGLSYQDFAKDYWVAYAFWVTGFFGTLLFGFARRSKTVNPKVLLTMFALIGIIVLAFSSVNYAYAQLPQDVWSERVGTSGVGVAEEIFFGVFLLGLLINWLGLNRILAVVVSAGVHAVFHRWIFGTDVTVLTLFFVCFVLARSIYVFVFPKVGLLLGAHGLWNFLVAGGGLVKKVGDLAIAWVLQRLDWLRAT